MFCFIWGEDGNKENAESAWGKKKKKVKRGPDRSVVVSDSASGGGGGLAHHQGRWADKSQSLSDTSIDCSSAFWYTEQRHLRVPRERTP